MLGPLFNKVPGLTTCSFIQMRLQNMCFLVNIAKFFYSKPLVASVDLLFLIKSNVGWFLLKRVDLVIVQVIYTLLVEIISTCFYSGLTPVCRGVYIQYFKITPPTFCCPLFSENYLNP